MGVERGLESLVGWSENSYERWHILNKDQIGRTGQKTPNESSMRYSLRFSNLLHLQCNVQPFLESSNIIVYMEVNTVYQ